MKKPTIKYKQIIRTALLSIPDIPEIDLLDRNAGYNIKMHDVSQAPTLINQIKEQLSGQPMAVMLRGQEIIVRPVGTAFTEITCAGV